MKPADAPEWMDEADFELDLGDDHWAHFLSAGGEGVTRDGQPVPFVEKACVIVTHRQPKSPSGWCQGAAPFKRDGEPRGWDVISLEPLELSPSLLCKANFGNGQTCEDHGFIRAGRWVRA